MVANRRAKAMPLITQRDRVTAMLSDHAKRGDQSHPRPPTLGSAMIGGRPPRGRERGNSLLLALIVMSALGTLGSLTVVSVQSSLRASTNERAHAIAMYAAESGAAVAMKYLRDYYTDRPEHWSSLVSPNNTSITQLAFPSNAAQPGEPANLFTVDQNAWYRVEVLNNIEDPQFAAGLDGDRILRIRSTGHGPQGSVAILEVDVSRFRFGASEPAPVDQPLFRDRALVLLSWRVVL